jgi:hypothetical protein
MIGFYLILLEKMQKMWIIISRLYAHVVICYDECRKILLLLHFPVGCGWGDGEDRIWPIF